MQFDRTNDLESYFHLYEILCPQYAHMSSKLAALNANVAALIWNEAKEHRHPVHGSVRSSAKKRQEIYYPRSARRQRVMLWALSALKMAMGEMGPEVVAMVGEWVDTRAEIVTRRYAARRSRAQAKNVELLRAMEELPPAERLVQQALFHATSEGTLRPDVTADGAVVFNRPGFIAEGKVVVPLFFPLVGTARLDVSADDGESDDDSGEEQEEQGEEESEGEGEEEEDGGEEGDGGDRAAPSPHVRVRRSKRQRTTSTA